MSRNNQYRELRDYILTGQPEKAYSLLPGPDCKDFLVDYTPSGSGSKR